MTGRWIALDGIDCVGKSTQVRLVSEYLSGHGTGALSVEEFSGGPIGGLLRKNVEEQRFLSLNGLGTSVAVDTLALVADLAYTVQFTIRPAIEQGYIVVSDRGPLSLVAYQLQRMGSTSAFAIEEVEALVSTWALCGCEVQTILLVADMNTVGRRSHQRDGLPLAPDELDFLDRVQRRLRALGSRGRLGSVLGEIDVGTRSLAEVTTSIVGLLACQASQEVGG
jgi:dTMP kinase